MHKVYYHELQFIRHSDAWSLQESMRNLILEHQGSCHLFMVEHPPTITLGRAEKGQNLHQSVEHLRAQGFDVVNVNRGGKITYHGPGQLVVYPVLDLKKLKLGIKDYVCKLEQTMIDTLQIFGLLAARKDGIPGVYLNHKKIGSLGIHVKKFVSIHGIALNVSANLDHFSVITPCGIQNMEMTSMKNEGVQTSLDEVAKVYAGIFEKIMHCTLEPANIDGHTHQLTL